MKQSGKDLAMATEIIVLYLILIVYITMPLEIKDWIEAIWALVVFVVLYVVSVKLIMWFFY